MVLEMLGGWYLGMLAGVLTSLSMWLVAHHRGRAIARRRRSLPRQLTRHSVSPPPDLAKFRFPLIHSQFVPQPTADALYRPASGPNMPADVYRHPRSTAYYECVPSRSGESPSLIMVDQHASIGTIDEHVQAFQDRLERQVRRLLVTPASQNIAMPLPGALLADEEDSPPVWLDALQRTGLALHWQALTALQAEPAYQHAHLISLADVQQHTATRLYDAMLATRAAPYTPDPEELGPPGNSGHVESVTVTMRDLRQAIEDWSARQDDDRESLGLRYFDLPDCAPVAVE